MSLFSTRPSASRYYFLLSAIAADFCRCRRCQVLLMLFAAAFAMFSLPAPLLLMPPSRIDADVADAAA